MTPKTSDSPAVETEAPAGLEYPELANCNATIKKIDADKDKTVMQLIIDAETASDLLQEKAHWGSVRVIINSTQSQLEADFGSDEDEENEDQMNADF